MPGDVRNNNSNVYIFRRHGGLARFVGEAWCEPDGGSEEAFAGLEVADEGNTEVFIGCAVEAT